MLRKRVEEVLLNPFSYGRVDSIQQVEVHQCHQTTQDRRPAGNQTCGVPLSESTGRNDCSREPASGWKRQRLPVSSRHGKENLWRSEVAGQRAGVGQEARSRACTTLPAKKTAAPSPVVRRPVSLATLSGGHPSRKPAAVYFPSTSAADPSRLPNSALRLRPPSSEVRASPPSGAFGARKRRVRCQK
jgi:hypothetical protein